MEIRLMVATWRDDIALLRRLDPKHVLFLCVANSARSQLAEGIARRLVAGRVRISSAGSAPTSPRPEAITVLIERSIERGTERAKHMDELADQGVDAVITLCAEEACPIWLGDALRIHWPLPDPAGRGLDAFRAVADELERRLGELWG